MTHGIWYVGDEDNQLIGFTYSDFARSVDDKRSMPGYAFCLDTSIVSWASKKQPIVTISSAEVEYVAAT